MLSAVVVEAAKPNIVLIVADDMGMADVGYHGYKDVLTPNIDKIAADGVHFTQGYVSASVCGPSRAGMMAGVYQQKFGCGENPDVTGYPDCRFPKAGVPTSQKLLPEMLKEEGYTTGMVGKWHLGVHPELRPSSRGFDFYFGFLNGSHSYVEWTNEMPRRKDKWPVFRNDKMEPPRKDIYLTDLFSDEAVDFIDREHDKPFFLYMAYNAVHGPWEVPQSYLERTKGLTDSANRNHFAAMVLAMDDGIGRVQDALKKHGIEENTIVIFITDNGSPTHQGISGNTNTNGTERMQGRDFMSNTGELRGYKGDTYEGGIRVPFCMSWPAQIKPGTVYDKPVSALDLVPTLVKKDVPTDGVDLLPYLKGEKDGRPHEVLYWRRDNDYAIRKGDWKLQWNDFAGSTKIMLFNLANDPNEERDLAAQNPELAQALQDQFDAWDNQLPDNEWWGGSINRKRHRLKRHQGTDSVMRFNSDPPKGHAMHGRAHKK